VDRERERERERERARERVGEENGLFVQNEIMELEYCQNNE
jgi:hypothetical protein